MWILRAFSVIAAGVLVFVASMRPAEADTVFASQVVSYNSGTNYPTSWYTGDLYTTPTAAVGMPSGITGTQDWWSGPSLITPFNGPYDTTDLVAIGEGGQLTLKLAQPAYVKPGLSEVGVFTNATLLDSNWPNGTCTNPAQILSDNYANVAVSQDGTHWVSLGAINLNIPTNYSLNTTGPYVYESTLPANTQVANFGQPFTGTLSSFNGLNYSQILTLLNGSAGGTWLNLSATGLGSVQYIQFSVPDAGFDDGSQTYADINAISIATGALTPVPEPAPYSLLALGGGLAWLLNRRRRTA